MKLSAFWGPRLESYDVCADKLARLIPAINQALGDDAPWLENEGGVVDPAPAAIGRHMDRHMSVAAGDAFGDMGWSATFHRARPRAYSTLRMRCGASAWIGNNISLDFPDFLPFDCRSLRALIFIIDKLYKADHLAIHSPEAVRRRLSQEPRPPYPVIDWMVYLANTIIPPEELPMVHSVEQVGSGTLVILKAEPIDFENPADLRLVEAVEAMIRRHQSGFKLQDAPRMLRQA